MSFLRMLFLAFGFTIFFLSPAGWEYSFRPEHMVVWSLVIGAAIGWYKSLDTKNTNRQILFGALSGLAGWSLYDRGIRHLIHEEHHWMIVLGISAFLIWGVGFWDEVANTSFSVQHAENRIDAKIDAMFRAILAHPLRTLRNLG